MMGSKKMISPKDYRRLQVIVQKLMNSKPPVSKSITKVDME
jgi:hypothetical protein